MIKGCLIAAAVAFAVFVGAGAYLWAQRDAIVQGFQDAVQLPDHGKPEYIKPRHGRLFATIDAAAQQATSKFEFAAAVEKLELPEEVVYLGFKAGSGTTDIVKRKEWNGHNTLVWNNYGAGSLKVNGDNIEIMINENPGPWNYMDGYVVYLEHKGDKTPEQPASRPTAKNNQ